MAKLYLIRRNFEAFTGPVTLSEMKEAYKRMQFGLQDEVSGHCGPWVKFDDMAAIKKIYPDVARIVNDEMLSGWGVSEPGSRLPNEDTKRIDVKPPRGIGLALAFLAVAVAAFLAAIYMANAGKLSGKVKAGDPELTPETLQGYLDKSDATSFDTAVQDNLESLLERTQRPKKPELQWLPYLRVYAFTHEGQINGLPAKLLRGDGAASAPIDCSLRTWRRRWRASLKSWPDLMTSGKLIRAHWSRLLAWDPHWIRRRDNPGWLGKQSYYLGCLAMADRALTEMYSDPTLVSTVSDWDRIGINKIRQRLLWLLETTRDGQSRQVTAPTPGNALSYWTCYEGARDVKELARCRDGVAAPTDQDMAQLYNDERYGWNMLRVTLAVRGPLPPEHLAMLTQQAARMSKGDYFTRFDYRPELRLMRAFLKAGVPVEKSIERTQAEFPDVDLAH